MPEEEIAYLIARAEQELERAQKATDPLAVQAHYDLATAYLDRIYDESGSVRLSDRSTCGPRDA